MSGNFFRLTALFGPQHGFESTTQDNMVEWDGFTHSRLGIPVFSLYGEHREPIPGMLRHIDALFIDLVDVGSRYYTFIWTMYLSMKACEAAGIPVIVADRPNPLNGIATEGPPQRADHLSFVGLHPLPNRHGKTIGELAVQFRDEMFHRCRLHVLPMENWERAMWHDETGLPWVLPSPNMPTLDTAIVYPRHVSVGRHQPLRRPRHHPALRDLRRSWIDGWTFCKKLNAFGLPGVHFREAAFEATFQKHRGKLSRGARIHVTDRESFLPWRTGIEIIRLARAENPAEFAWKPLPYEYEPEKLPIEILCGARSRHFFRDNRVSSPMPPCWIADRTLLHRILILLAMLVSEMPAQSAQPEVTWREILAIRVPGVGLLADPAEFTAIAPPRAVAVEGIRSYTEALADVYETFDQPPETHYFFCTVYYTPRESGFTKAGGYNVAPAIPKGLSRAFPSDFVKATGIEGFGKIANPAGAGQYLKYDGTWGFRDRILGNRNNTLVDRESLAVHKGNPLFSPGARVWILDPELYNTFGSLRYRTADTGGGLYRSQIDIYWGEDDPLGPGADIWRPATCDVAVRWIVPVQVWK